jgi:hypothetical protein
MNWGAFFAFLAVVMLVPADVAQAQARGISWQPPVVLGRWSMDTARINDLPEVSSADWPTMHVEWLAEMRHCSRLYADLRDWTIHTVTAQSFYVEVRNGDTWENGGPFFGFTFPQLKRIYVVQYGLHRSTLIKHEVLHALLAEKGLDPRHNTNVADGMFARCFKAS